MLKKSLFTLCLIVSFAANAQIQVSKLIGKDSDKFKIGYGAFLEFSYPLSQVSDITLEGGFTIFDLKKDTRYGITTIPVKLGYRYIFSDAGYGFYAEPQVGYNVGGVDAADKKFTGLVYAVGAGYLFRPSGKIQFNAAILYESALNSGSAINYLSFRLSHNFSFKRRETE